MQRVEIFDDRPCRLGEGPFYDERTDRVWWVDILGRRLLWRAFGRGDAGPDQTGPDQTGTHRIGTHRIGTHRIGTDQAGTDRTGPRPIGEVGVGEHVGAVVPDAAGGRIVCLPAGPAALAHPSDRGEVAPVPLARYPQPAPGSPAMRSNDAKVDPAGRLWLGTMAYDATPGAAALYRLDPGSPELRTMVASVTVSNGLGWSPTQPRMYYNDTPTGRIDVFDYDEESGEITNRRPFAVVERGLPDGLCVDAAGGVWVALWEGSAVLRFSPTGELVSTLSMPTPRVTSCTFAGPDLDTLVVTTAASEPDDGAGGRTYAYRPGDVVGVPVHRFGAAPAPGRAPMSDKL